MFDRRDPILFGLALAGVSSAGLQLNAADVSAYLLFSKGPLLVRPRLAVSEAYTDNLFAQTDGTADFISTLSPGVNIQFGRLARNFIALDYSLSQHFYAERSDLNSGEHNFALRSRIQGDRLAVSGSDSVQLLSSPVGLVTEYFQRFAATPPTPGPEGGALPQPVGGEPPGAVQGPEVISAIADRSVDRNSFFDGYSLIYAISEKTGVYLQGQHSTTDYEQGISLYDMNTLRGTVGFGFQAFPKIGFFGEVYYGQTATTPNFPAPKNPHIEFLGGGLGVRGSFTEKLSGAVRVGYEARKFSDRTPTPSSPVADVSLSYRATQKTAFSLSFARLHDVSIQYGRESYTANVTSIQWDQVLGASHKWRASLGGRFGTFDYQSPDSAAQRQYDQYSAYFRLAYQIQLWLSASLGYTWDSIRTGSGGGSDYDINRASIGIAIGY
jgi:hypothetical protein